MNLDDALQTFFVESRELLDSMEDALLRIEQSPDDADTINAIFRVAHTIKGSAGLFGLDDIVSFTHVAESVLDKVRNGELRVNADMAAALLASGDHIRALVDAVASGSELSPMLRQQGVELINRLNAWLGIEAAEGDKEGKVPAEYELPHTAKGGGEVETDLWHISLRFGRDVLRNGMDPLSFIRYLSTMGDIEQVFTLLNQIPSAGEMDPESCYLGFEISFKSNASKSDIENVFEFVREDSVIRILPPRSKIDEYLHVIADLPMTDMRVGEILIRCGTLTEAELANALRLQQEAASTKEPPRPIGEVLLDAHMVQPTVMEAALEKQKQIKEQKSN